VFAHVRADTGLFVDFYDAFDRMVMSERSGWFGGRTRDEVFTAALQAALEGEVQPWSAQRRLMLTNLFFGGKVPDLLGFDRGPIRLPGGRATVCQGQIYRSAGRLTSFAAAVRIIAPMAETSLYTNLAGGPSDRRFSPWYSSDLRRWLVGEYKKLEP
jgi:penicillin amidase